MRASRLDTALWLLSVLDRETDDYGTIAKLVTLYRFAIANYANPLAQLLSMRSLQWKLAGPWETNRWKTRRDSDTPLHVPLQTGRQAHALVPRWLQAAVVAPADQR
jgi:hypothetical protein